MLKSLIITAALVLIGGHAMAGKCNPESLILHGAYFRGAAACNTAWLDRTSSLAVLDLARDCRTLAGRKWDALLERGMNDFDRNVKEVGHDGACKKLDANMKRFEEKLQ